MIRSTSHANGPATFLTRRGGVRGRASFVATLTLSLSLFAAPVFAGESEAVAGSAEPAAASISAADPDASERSSSLGGLYEPWRYDTGYFFGLSRGLWEEEGLSPGFRPAVLCLTLPLDLVILPAAALAGLFG